VEVEVEEREVVGRTVTMVSAAPARPPAAMLAITEDEGLSMAV
jgi:hypothetical protein